MYQNLSGSRLLMLKIILAVTMILAGASAQAQTDTQPLTTEVRQITSGPEHHFFGYIGHVRTIPWNSSGRYIVALQTSFQDRMPAPGEPARIVLIDTHNNFSVRIADQTRAWNFQQGTMLYWNPEAPETQFFFNDRDPETNQLFCVLFDISAGEHGQRISEFRFADTPAGNSGVAQQGGRFPRDQLRTTRPPSSGYRLSGCRRLDGGTNRPSR